MTFYAYSYFANQSGAPTWQYTLMGLLLLGWVILSVLYIRNRLQTKYRDGSIILLLCGLFFLGLSYSDFEHRQQDNDNQSKMMTFLSAFQNDTQSPSQDIAVNSRTPSNGMIVKDGQNFYSVTFSSDFTAYYLESVYIINKDITILTNHNGGSDL